MRSTQLRVTELLLLAAGFVAMICVQLVFNQPPFTDEHDYLTNVAILHRYGFGFNYLRNLVGSAGPLYSMVHYFFEPVTHLRAPYVRWVNSGLLICVGWFVYLILKRSKILPRLFALYAMAIPMVYVIAGCALTEMPAMFFFTAALLLAIYSQSGAPRNQLPLAAAAGICMGFAIIGRQPYLLTLAAFPVLMLKKNAGIKQFLPLALLCLFSLLLPAYVFYAWNGLVPTIESQLYKDIAAAGTLYRPDFVVLCLFYFAASMWIIAPAFFHPPVAKRSFVLIAVALLLIVVLNLFFAWISVEPVRGFTRQVIPAGWPTKMYTLFCGGLAIAASIYFMACGFLQLYMMKSNREALFIFLALLLVAGACMKITWGFSSRYAAQALPLLVLFGAFFYRRSHYNILRIAIGVITGLITLITYFPRP